MLSPSASEYITPQKHRIRVKYIFKLLISIMDTSKTRSIRLLLLQAWRERWSDVTWGIRIKSVLPRGVSGDVYDLADCILQQALVGPGPNVLFMSYLVHSLSSRVVSYGAVLSSIGRYQSFSKPYCILSLLELLKTFQSRIGCHGNEEECIALCKAVVSVTHWLYSCVLHSITKLAELKQSPEHMSIMEKSYEALFYFSDSTFIKSLLYVGKFEDQDMYAQMLQKHKELESKISQVPSTNNLSKETVEGALSLVSLVDNLPKVPLEKIFQGNKRLQLISSTLNVMISIDAVLNPASDITAFGHQLLLVKELQGFTLSQLYCEIVRSCFIGQIDAAGSNEELKWAAFTFLKVPKLISKIQTIQKDGEENALERGLDLLLQFTPMLDLTDVKSNCDCFQYLTNELYKVEMLTEVQMQKLVARRQRETLKHTPTRTDQQRSQAGANLILRAEPTVVSILKSLDSDYSKIQEALLEVLCHMAPGKNFELILSAAAATGKLATFATKLINFNEYHKYVSPEASKASQTRALLFDITFLMLCHIAQQYGIQIVTTNPDVKDSFFVTWASECLSEGGKFKFPDTILHRSEPSSVDLLITQIIDTEQELKTSQVKWHEVCTNAPAAAKEIVIAWEYGAVSTENVKMYLDHIKGYLCCLPVCISAYLCNYINVLHHEERLKPMNMLQHFMTPFGESTISESLATEMSNADKNQFYKERSTLMVGIIKKMMYDLHPPPQAQSKLAPIIPHGLTVRESLGKLLDDTFAAVHIRGWINLKSIHYFETLLCVGGGPWLCERLVRKILSFQYMSDINRAVDIALGVFNLDIEQCALALLVNVLPFYLYSEVKQEHFAEPHGTAIAKLAVMTTYAALQARRASSLAGVKAGYKRSYREMEIDSVGYGEHSRSSKIQRSNAELLEDTPFKLQSSSEDHIRSAISNPINKAIADIMRTLLVIASDCTMSARSLFPIRFLEQVVLCAKDQVHEMLQFMPLGLVSLLLKNFPEEFSHELILAVSSMQSPRARKVSALALCQLTIAQSRLNNKYECWLGFNYQLEPKTFSK